MTTKDYDYSVYGQEVEESTTAHTTPTGTEYYAMQVIADAVVASMTWAEDYAAASDGDWSDLTSIPAGTVLTGRFTALTLTSGEVILHLRPKL